MFSRLSSVALSNAHVLVKRCFKNKTVSCFFLLYFPSSFPPACPVRYSLITSFRKIQIFLWAFLFLHVPFLLFFDILKGLGNQMNIFIRPTQLHPYISVHVQMVFTFLAVVKKKNKFKVSACFFASSKYYSESPIIFFPASWSTFSGVY
jgi:hypothetical protein